MAVDILHVYNIWNWLTKYEIGSALMADKLRNTVYDLKYRTSLKMARVRGRNAEHQNYVLSSQLENNCAYNLVAGSSGRTV